MEIVRLWLAVLAIGTVLVVVGGYTDNQVIGAIGGCLMGLGIGCSALVIWYRR
jgi:hypothetical protein